MNLKITARNFTLTDSIRTAIERQASKLEALYYRIQHCQVFLEVPHRHHHKGILYNVRVDIVVPKKEIAVRRVQDEDLYVAIHDTFSVARSQLLSYLHRRRGEVKYHFPHATRPPIVREEYEAGWPSA